MAARKLQLIYFPVRARAEATRMILEFGNITYTDESPTSFYGKGWKEAKALSPMGQLPALVVDGGAPIAQSGASATARRSCPA